MKDQSNSYLGSLTEEHREQVFALLSQRPRLSLVEVSKRAPVFGAGPSKGKKPSFQVIGKVNAKLQLEQSLEAISVQAKFMEAMKVKALGLFSKSEENEQLLETVIGLINNEVIQKTLEGEDAAGRTAAARLLLKRADQRRFDRRMEFLEKQKDDAKQVLGNQTLTPEEKDAKMREIFGL